MNALRLVAALLTIAAVAAKPRWRNFFLHADMVMGMSFLDMKQGWAIQTRQGRLPEAGPMVMKTVDGGQSWERLSFVRDPPMSILMPMDISISQNHSGVLVGAGMLMMPGRLFTKDGLLFDNSLAMGMDAARNVQPFGEFGAFAAVGVFSFDTNGVAISRDGGVTWEQIAWPSILPVVLAPNSAQYINEKLWYVGAGMYPKRNNDAEDSMDLPAGWTARGVRDAAKTGGRIELVAPEADAATSNDYYTKIRKTEDGGKTWTDVFTEVGGYSYESMSCVTAATCYAAGGSSLLGGRLIRTDDGGKTWQTVVEYSKLTLSTVTFFDHFRGWITGGWPQDKIGWAARTVDAGKTWETYKLATYPLYAQFFDMDNGWASGPNFYGGGMDLTQFQDWSKDTDSV